MDIKKIIISIACCASMMVCHGASYTVLKKRLDDLVKPLLSFSGNMLLRQPPMPGAAKNEPYMGMKNFLKNDFLKFIGSDNEDRKEWATVIANDMNDVLSQVFSSFSLLARLVATWDQQSNVKGAQAQIDFRKAQASAVFKIMASAVDPNKIPWGKKTYNGLDITLSVLLAKLINTLEKAEDDIRQVKAYVNSPSGKKACLLNWCKERFDLLFVTADALGRLINLIKEDIQQLRSVQAKYLGVESREL